jgi:hypothetical protein
MRRVAFAIALTGATAACPHARKTVRYRWNVRRIVADGEPPLAYGERGNRLHLAPR